MSLNAQAGQRYGRHLLIMYEEAEQLSYSEAVNQAQQVTYDTGRLHYDEITLKGVFHFTPADVKKAYKLLCEGKLRVSRLISGSYPLKHIQKAFDKLAKGEGIKYAIIP